ncbi:MAG: hypothetical protein ABI744_06565 [Chloroflexota bacterium]
MSSFWRGAFNVQYRLLARFDPAIRAVWRRGGIGNVLELRVARRDGKGERRRMLGLLHAGGGLYLGHPNGEVGWTRDLEAAGGGTLRYPNGVEWRFSAVRLPPGDEREQAIRATGQHPFPGNLVYRLGRRHVRRFGVFFRLHEAA